MTQKDYAGLHDGDIIENIITKKKYVVRVEITETMPKVILINYIEEFKIVSKVKYESE